MNPPTEVPRLELLCLELDGPPVGTVDDAVKLLEESFSRRATVIAIPKERLHAEFLDLSTRMAGEFLQKMVNYRRTVALLGDFSAEAAASKSLRDFIVECNRGQQIFFLPDLGALQARLAK